MINKRLLIKNLLAHNDESSFYDKKRQLNLHSKEGKAKFLKHICALSNSNPTNNSYIVVGVEDHDNEIVGDDFLVSNSNLIREAAKLGAANTVLLKPNQRGTLSETLEAWKVAQELGYSAIVSARSGETEDTTIVDLAIGWNVGQLKVGSFARSERMVKWNHALRIEEQLGVQAHFAGSSVFKKTH